MRPTTGSTALDSTPPCRVTSPGGHLVCANARCDGRSHVWVHESSAPDRKRDADATLGATAA